MFSQLFSEPVQNWQTGKPANWLTIEKQWGGKNET